MGAERTVVVLISGSGSNLQALIDAQNTPALPNAKITLVFSNRKAAYGLTRAAQANPSIPTAYLALQPYLKANPGKTRADYDVEVARIVLRENPDLIVLAGWMHIFGEGFLELADGIKPLNEGEEPRKPVPVINLHPALPGAFDGASAIERAFDAFQKGEIAHSGAMVHRVVKDVDRGEPLIVREVPIIKEEAIEAFEERLHKVEHEIIVLGAAKALDLERPHQAFFVMTRLTLLTWETWELRPRTIPNIHQHMAASPKDALKIFGREHFATMRSPMYRHGRV